MPTEVVVYRCMFRCICGDSFIIRTDHPYHIHGMRLYCSGCKMPLGKVLIRQVHDGYTLRLVPDSQLLAAMDNRPDQFTRRAS